MKAKSLHFIVVLALAACVARAQNTVFTAQPTGSQMKIDGTSTLHDWTIKSGVIGGKLELDSKFLADPTKAQPGKVPASAEVFIPVRTLKSYMTKMDTVVYQAMNMTNYPKIEYRLTDLTLKETPKAADGPYSFESKGQLAVNGTTNPVAFPVTITRNGKILKTAGSYTLKMSDYKVQPPSPSIPIIGKIKTGDEVTLTFDWATAEK